MKNLFTLSLCFFLLPGIFAQTKKIAFKSHSGSKSAFKTAYDNNLFDMSLSNFGLDPTYKKSNKLDSLIYVSEEEVIMVISHYRSDNTKVRKQVRLPVTNDPVLLKKHDLKEVKKHFKLIRQNYGFINSVRSVKFVGYDNKKPKTDKKEKDKSEFLLPGQSNTTRPPSDNSLPLTLAFTALLTLLTSLFAGRLQRS